LFFFSTQHVFFFFFFFYVPPRPSSSSSSSRSLLHNHEYEQAHVWGTTVKSHAPPRFDGDNQNQQSHSAQQEEEGGNAENKTILHTTHKRYRGKLVPATQRYQNYPAHPTGVGPLRFPIPAGTHRSTEKGAGPSLYAIRYPIYS